MPRFSANKSATHGRVPLQRVASEPHRYKVKSTLKPTT
jgi:hypothetical protein